MNRWQQTLTPVHRALSLAAAVILALILLAGDVYAQTPNRAGLVVVHGDGSVMSRCVQFESESISGYELLERSGLSLRTEVSGMGPTICAIDEEGCAAGEHCFCRCLSSTCEYWSYWRLEETGWSYAQIGAGNTTVTDGMVEAWVWSEGTIQRSADRQPPEITLEDICEAEPAQPSATTAATEVRDETQDETSTGPLAGPLGMLVVIGAPLLAAVVWWAVRQAGRDA